MAELMVRPVEADVAECEALTPEGVACYLVDHADGPHWSPDLLTIGFGINPGWSFTPADGATDIDGLTWRTCVGHHHEQNTCTACEDAGGEWREA